MIPALPVRADRMRAQKHKAMTHELIAALIAAAGQGPVMLVEVRGQSVEKKSWNDKATGKPTGGAFINTIAAETIGAPGVEPKQVTLELWAPKGAEGMEPLTIEAAGQPSRRVQRGEKLIVVLDGYEHDFKGTRARLRSYSPWNGQPSEPAKEAGKK